MKKSGTPAGGGKGNKAPKKPPVVGPTIPPANVGPTGIVPAEGVRQAAKALGLAELGQGVAAFVAQTLEYQLREVVEDAIKVRTQSRRRTLTVEDVNFALRLRGQQPLYGYGGSSGGGGGEGAGAGAGAEDAGMVLLGERREELARAMQADLPKVPREPALALHWLAIDGVQPLVPQNPPPQSAPETPAPIPTEGGAVVIPEKTHPLSEELWAYYKKVVRTAMDPHAPEREKRAVFASLGGDPGLHELVPYLSLHVHNTVTAAVGPQGRGALDPLWAATRLFRCMVANPHMHLELYLHQMLPSVMTVIANNRLAAGVGGGLGGGDHYALRAFAAQTLAMLVRKYAPVYRPLASVICKTFAERAEEFLADTSSSKAAVATLYGAVIGIRHLGPRPVELVLLPLADRLLARLEGIVEDRGAKPRRRREAQHCHAALTAAVGEFMERRQRRRPGVGVERLMAEGGGDEAGAAVGRLGGLLGGEALVAYAAQSRRFPELEMVV